MDQEDNVVRVSAFYDALANADIGKLQAMISDDIEWVNPLPDLIPFGGEYHGADGLLSYFQKLSEAIDMKPLQIDHIVGDGDIVAAIGVEASTLVKFTEKRYTMPFTHVLRFDENGKVCHVREYNDIREMIIAFTD